MLYANSLLMVIKKYFPILSLDLEKESPSCNNFILSNMNNFYANKIALAPMVKAGRTSLRCLSLDYGADLVYTEEIIDVKLLQSKRIVNGKFNNIMNAI